MSREYTVAARSQIAPGCMRRVQIDERGYVIFNVEGELYAARDVCPHKGAPLSAGDLFGTVVVCPLHAWEFDVRSGECVSMPEWSSLVRCDVRLDGEMIRLTVDDDGDVAPPAATT